MNVYEEIDQETMMLLLDSLCKRTVEGKQIWENMEYNPISFLQKDIYEKERCLHNHKYLKQRQYSMVLNMN